MFARREHFITCCAYDRKVLGIANIDLDEVEILDLVTVVNPVAPEIATADDRGTALRQMVRR